MTPIEMTEAKLGHLGLTAEQLVEIRDVTDILARIIVRGYWEKQTNGTETDNDGADDTSSTKLPEGGILSDTGKSG